MDREVLHEQIVALGIVRLEIRMVLHALVDLGLLTAIACQADECVIGDRHSWGVGRVRNGPSIDHLIERRNGGNERPENLRLLHISCNTARNRGRVTPDDVRERIAASQRGRAFTPEHAQAVREAAQRRRGVPLSEEHRAKVSASLRGRPVSAETRAKMSAAQKAHQEKKRMAKLAMTLDETGAPTS